MAPHTPSSGLGGLNLRSLAQSAGGETSKRMAGGTRAYGAAAQSGVTERKGFFLSGEEAQGRQHAHENRQQAADAALARRQQSLREGTGAAQRRYSALSAARSRRIQEMQEKEENADWFDKQRFTTDENIRQAQAMAAWERDNMPEEESGIPRLSDFGPRSIDPLRGAALNEQQPGFISLSDDDRTNTANILKDYSDDPAGLIQAMRDKFGKRARTASYALWDAGYGLGG